MAPLHTLRRAESSEAYPPFAEAQRLNVPVCIHVGEGVPAGTERFDHPFFTHAIAHPFEQMIATLCVVAGGLLERFPRLKFAFMEAGCGWGPLLDGTARRALRVSPTDGAMAHQTAERVHEEHPDVLCFEMEEKMLPYVAKFVGADRLVFSTDYNHSDSKFPHTVEEVIEREDLSDALKVKLMGENAARLYSL